MKERIEKDAIYTAEDVARLVGLKPAAIRRWIREKKLPATKLGKRYLVRGEALLALVPANFGHAADGEVD